MALARPGSDDTPDTLTESVLAPDDRIQSRRGVDTGSSPCLRSWHQLMHASGHMLRLP